MHFSSPAALLREECTYSFISNLIYVHNLLDTDVLQEYLDWSVGL